MADFAMPPRVPVALLPTRIERIARFGERLRGVEVWMKRDDLTGYLLSGNKIRKLEFSFARALAGGADAVVTCGGVQSNHCRATAGLAARLGLGCDLFLRTPDGNPPEKLQGNTLLDAILGARIHWIDPDAYAARDALLSRHCEEEGLRGRKVYSIPEGASDGVGALGYVNAALEIKEQLEAKNVSIDYVVHPIGSGGTSAGLAAGRDQFGAKWRVLGIPVCDDAAYFAARIREIRTELTQLFHLPETDDPAGGVELVDGYQGRGYGLTTPEELRWYHEFARDEGILLDPCYTGKAFYGLYREIESGRIPEGSRILFLHTGGVFANFSYDEWGQVLSG